MEDVQKKKIGRPVTGRTKYKSLIQCSKAENIPYELLKKAKANSAPGMYSNGDIAWLELKPWLELHRDELDIETNDSIQFFKKEIAKRDVILRDLEIKKAKSESLDPEDVKKFLVSLATLLSSILKKKKSELSSKCIGYETIIDTEFIEIFAMIQNEVSSFNKKAN